MSEQSAADKAREQSALRGSLQAEAGKACMAEIDASLAKYGFTLDPQPCLVRVGAGWVNSARTGLVADPKVWG